MNLKFPSLLFLGTLLFTSCEQKSSTGSAADPAKLEIAVIPKGTSHVFWKTVEAGVRQAGDELGVNIIWKGPLKENDRAQQISIVEQLVSEGVQGVVLSPLDNKALVRPVQAAMAKGTPVVIMDSSLDGTAGKDFTSYVATDNVKGGCMAAQELLKLLGGKGKVVMLRYLEGSASTVQREEAFLEEMKKHPEIEVLIGNRYGGATAGEIQSTALNLIDTIRQADGIFCSNEPTTFGMLLALRQSNLAGKIKFVGFDTAEPLIEALKAGEVQCLIAQNPKKIGYEAVKTVVAHLRGEKVPDYVDTGVHIVTSENLNSAEIKEVLQIK